MVDYLRPGLAASFCLTLFGCASAKVTRQADIGPVPSTRNTRQTASEIAKSVATRAPK